MPIRRVEADGSIELISETEVLARVGGLSRQELGLCIEAGWLVPAERRAGEPYFLQVDVARARLIHELRVDLALGEEALPVILSLIDQLHETRFRLACVLDAVADQPEDQRSALLASLRERLRAVRGT